MAFGYILKPANENIELFGTKEEIRKNKERFIANFAAPLRQTREGVVDLALSEDGDVVTIIFQGGSTRPVSIAGDSWWAIMRDILAAI